jgi:hypothetical protein
MDDIMRWDYPHEAYWKGFKDAYKGILDRLVENQNEHYERGFINGLGSQKTTSGKVDYEREVTRRNTLPFVPQPKGEWVI